jgi:hypothetical protein
MTKIEIIQAENVPSCGDGCCHDDGLIINKIINGKHNDDLFYQTDNLNEIQRVVELLKFMFGEDNVKFIPLNKK